MKKTDDTNNSQNIKKYLSKKQLKKKNARPFDTKMVLLNLNECGGGFSN